MWSVQKEERAETPRVGAMGFRVPHDVGYAVEPQSVGERDGSRCTSRRHDSPDAGARTNPSGRDGSSAGGPRSKQAVHQEIRQAEMRRHHELSSMQISDDGHDCSRAH